MYLLFYLKILLKVYFSILFLILLEKCNYLALIGGGVGEGSAGAHGALRAVYSQ